MYGLHFLYCVLFPTRPDDASDISLAPSSPGFIENSMVKGVCVCVCAVCMCVCLLRMLASHVVLYSVPEIHGKGSTTPYVCVMWL